MKTPQMLEVNRDTYQGLYAKEDVFLRYPADWIIRFHNMYLKKHLPTGRVLDYGCGSGNNSVFFIQQGYDVYGVDVAPTAMDHVKENLKSRGLDQKHAEQFQVVPVDAAPLRFPDGFFDLIVSNQVLYYLASEQQIRKVCRELHRCLRPGGTVFFTVLGPKNYYITYHTKQIHDRRVYEVVIDEPGHRLFGLRELIYLVRDEADLKNLFSDFECVTSGYYDQRMFDMTSNFHWLFVGKKA